MNIVFIHKIFPGQFKHLIEKFSASPGHRVIAICQEFAPEFHARSFPGCAVKVYRPARQSQAHPQLERMDSDVSNGRAVASVLRELQAEGFHPDLILAHTGWGEALYCKDVFPDVPLIGYFEFYYHAQGADADFDPEQRLSLDDRYRIRTLNAGQLLNLVSCDAGVSPTRWQKQLYPSEFQGKIHAIHEGVDASQFKPDRSAAFTLPSGEILDRSAEIVTYVSRNLEPYRGFPQFMQAVEILQRRRPHVRVLIAGGDESGYSRRLNSGKSYREKVCEEINLDRSRVHFLGWLPYVKHRRLLQVSSVHVYLTVPFVLSWSVIEAMASGCVLVASDTTPVREVIRHGHNGLLFDFFSPAQIADAIDSVLDHPVRMKHLGEQARRDVMEDFNNINTVSRYIRLMENVSGQRIKLQEQDRVKGVLG